MGVPLCAVHTIFARIFLGDAPQGFTALIVAITFFAGMQLLFLGLIGEYLSRVYDEAQGRPHFLVTDVVGRDRAKGGGLNRHQSTGGVLGDTLAE